MPTNEPLGVLEFDRVRKVLADLVDRAIGDVLKANGFYRCTVTSQSGQNVDLQAEDPKQGSPKGVPLVSMFPQTQISVAAGGTCYLFFANGDRKKPRATCFELSTLVKLILGDPNNAKAVVRKGDAIEAGQWSAILNTLVWVGTDGTTWTVSFTGGGTSPIVVSLSQTPAKQTGTTTTGATKVFAE